jgi:outer membrane protein OmpA-like peptidoglycan-associated protein
MNISGFRPGPFAGPILIAAAIMVAAAGAAQAACPDLIKTFDKAVAERQMDAAINSLDDISDNPSQMCLGRLPEFRAKLVDFLIDYARTPGLEAATRDKTIAKAENIVEVSGHWQGEVKLGDYFFAQRDQVKAHAWYVKSVAALATPGSTPATDKDRKELAGKLAAAQSLANDDKGGTRRVSNLVRNRAADGSLGGLYSTALVHLRAAEVVAVPMPINFVYNQASFTPAGEEAMKELIEAAKQVTTMKLVGHADPRGTPEYNMNLSRTRVLAVRDRLVQAGAKTQAQVTVKWVGSSEAFDVSVLPDGDKLSQEEIWQLDRRVVWLRDAERE